MLDFPVKFGHIFANITVMPIVVGFCLREAIMERLALTYKKLIILLSHLLLALSQSLGEWSSESFANPIFYDEV